MTVVGVEGRGKPPDRIANSGVIEALFLFGFRSQWPDYGPHDASALLSSNSHAIEFLTRLGCVLT